MSLDSGPVSITNTKETRTHHHSYQGGAGVLRTVRRSRLVNLNSICIDPTQFVNDATNSIGVGISSSSASPLPARSSHEPKTYTASRTNQLRKDVSRTEAIGRESNWNLLRTITLTRLGSISENVTKQVSTHWIWSGLCITQNKH